jgi:hypothetical protein
VRAASHCGAAATPLCRRRALERLFVTGIERLFARRNARRNSDAGDDRPELLERLGEGALPTPTRLRVQIQDSLPIGIFKLAPIRI